jgi:hypothetical protein
MNRTSLALSVMTLGITIGITVTHFKHVRELTKYGLPSQDVRIENLDDKDPGTLKAAKREALSIAGGGGSGGEVKPLDSNHQSQKMTSSQPQDEALLEILVAMRAEQKALRKQIAESNRDIDELTFRVDTHSDSFKPLHAIEDRPRAMDRAVDNFDAEASGLLPPKP